MKRIIPLIIIVFTISLATMPALVRAGHGSMTDPDDTHWTYEQDVKEADLDSSFNVERVRIALKIMFNGGPDWEEENATEVHIISIEEEEHYSDLLAEMFETQFELIEGEWFAGYLDEYEQKDGYFTTYPIIDSTEWYKAGYWYAYYLWMNRTDADFDSGFSFFFFVNEQGGVVFYENETNVYENEWLTRIVDYVFGWVEDFGWAGLSSALGVTSVVLRTIAKKVEDNDMPKKVYSA